MTEDSKQKAAAGKVDFNTTIQSLWQGKVPLAQAFWIYYFAIVLALTVFGSILGPLARITGILGIVWAGFMVKPIWLAADAYQGPKHWAVLAKIAAVLVGIGVVLDVLAF